MISVKDIIKYLREEGLECVAGEAPTGELHYLAADTLDAQRRHIQLLDKEIVKLQAENAKLRKVAEAAREFVGCPCEDDGTIECVACTACNYRQALAELDKESSND